MICDPLRPSHVMTQARPHDVDGSTSLIMVCTRTKSPVEDCHDGIIDAIAGRVD